MSETMNVGIFNDPGIPASFKTCMAVILKRGSLTLHTAKSGKKSFGASVYTISGVPKTFFCDVGDENSATKMNCTASLQNIAHTNELRDKSQNIVNSELTDSEVLRLCVDDLKAEYNVNPKKLPELFSWGESQSLSVPDNLTILLNEWQKANNRVFDADVCERFKGFVEKARSMYTYERSGSRQNAEHEENKNFVDEPLEDGDKKKRLMTEQAQVNS